MTGRRTWLALALALACVSPPAARPPPAPPPAVPISVADPRVTHGPIVGDVGPDRATIWARSDGADEMWLGLRDTAGAQEIRRRIAVSSSADFTGKLEVEGLRPDTLYEYRVWFAAGERNRTGGVNVAAGRFQTAPPPDAARPVRFAWSGDLGGQNACRDRKEGYAIFAEIGRRDLDFFIGLGDMIYADFACEPLGRFGNEQIPGEAGRAGDLAAYWAHWRYNLAEENFRRVLANTSYVAVWDDHETVNDAGPLDDRRRGGPYRPGVPLLPIALRAFLDYNPVPEDPDTPGRLYRSLRWGRHLEVFALDTRQYRDSDRTPDLPESPKTMLGREQLRWLEAKLRASDATWKVILSSVPMSIPTGTERSGVGARDGWADAGGEKGYERELQKILRALEVGDQNAVWLTTDIHLALAFRYTPFKRSPGFEVHEFVAGPLSASLNRRDRFDETFGTEALFIYGPEEPREVADYEEAKRWFNFGAIEIDEQGRLTVEIVNARGERVWRHRLDPR